jgi:hypothetical protein
MQGVIKIKERTTGEIKTAVYAPNKKGNLRYHVDGLPIPDRKFDKLYIIVS